MRRALGGLLAVLALLACDRPVGEAAGSGAASSGEAPSAASDEAPAPLEYVEVLTGGADGSAPLPLVVAMHGRGGTPETFLENFRELPVPARVISLRAPIDEGDGRAWFVFRYGGARAIRDLRALVPRVMATLRPLRESVRGRPIATGFSQGGMIAYELALLEPDAFEAIFPVSAVRRGSVPAALPPHVPPIFAFHGTADPIIPLDAQEEDIRALRHAGARAELTPIEGAPHWITRPVRDALYGAMADVLLPSPTSAPPTRAPDPSVPTIQK